ncbi:C2 domain-containing protein [Baffinella frigidus]|nr:C2 domain-containing protein [Cryptophyta sp. CCMP2293]
MLETEELLLSPNPNLHISIIEARDLEAMDLSGLSDPYVTIRVGAEKWTINDKKKDSRWKLEQTKTINQNLDPTFNEQFSIALDDIEGWISLTVWDADTLSAHDPIGEVFIPIKDVFDASSSAEKLKEWQRARLSLSHPKKNDTSSMKLRISCRIGDSLSHPNTTDTTSMKLRIFCRIGHDAGNAPQMKKRFGIGRLHDAANVVQKKKRFGLSSLVMSGLKKIGRLKLENLSNVRAGVNDRELQADFRSSNGDHTQIVFRVDNQHPDPSGKSTLIVFRVDNKDPDPSGKPGLVMGEKTLAMRDEWLHALNLGVTKRLMAGKAR